jgi:hypothetical protein
MCPGEEKRQLMELLPWCHSIIQQKYIKFRSTNIYQGPPMWQALCYTLWVLRHTRHIIYPWSLWRSPLERTGM